MTATDLFTHFPIPAMGTLGVVTILETAAPRRQATIATLAVTSIVVPLSTLSPAVRALILLLVLVIGFQPR
ncbi:MAG: hypothetical protein A4E19_13800 [Nitrospira sp. SG-bin1]|nr:MAG: hypothetical protein A4E19_13800 [Nitrospira sp. SG-bin1]